MELLKNVNHVAIMTGDLNRFVEFYQGVFDLEVVFREEAPGFSHAILRTGTDSWIHPVEVQSNAHAAGVSEMFQRGHLDHMALVAASQASFHELRSRLVERGASNGQVDDLGAFHALWFKDPDGMDVELSVIVDATLQDIHEPRPMTESMA